MPIGAEVLYRHLIADANGVVGSITPLGTPAIDSTPFSKWSADNAKSAITHKISPIHVRAQNMYDGDHWQSGWGWIGPHPDPLNDALNDFNEAWKEIQQGFVSRNVVREIARRYRRAAMGREPRWTLVPRDVSALEEEKEPEQIIEPEPKPEVNPAARALTEARQRFKKPTPKRKKVPPELDNLISEATRALTLWWDERGLHEMLQKVITTLQMPSGRACVRIYVPDGLRRSTSGTTATKLEGSAKIDDALAKLYPEHPDPYSSVVFEDTRTKRKVGIVVYRVADETTTQGKELVELTYLSDDGKSTIVRTIDTQAATSSTSKTQNGIDLGGRLLTYEATLEPIITEQMIELQRALNLALTMLPRNITMSGFLNRIISNGMLPGKWEVDANGRRTGKYIVTDLPTFGAGYTNYITGQEIVNKDGTKQLSNVGIHETPPVDPTPTLRGVRGTYEAMLEEGEQDHVLSRGGGDSANSGRSQEQGRSGFESASDEIASRVNRLGRWMIETALAAAEVLMGQPGKYTSKLRAVFECRTRIGPVSVEERASWINAAEKGIVATDSAREAIGIYDVDAENDKIESQEGGPIDLRIRQANAFKMFIDSKLHGELAGELVGFSPELLGRLGQSFDESIQREQQQKEAQLATMTQTAEIGANAKLGRPGRPSGNVNPPLRQGQSKVTQKQVIKDRKRPKPQG